MSETMQLREPLFKLTMRFSNGELLQYLVQEPIDSRAISSETRYAIVTSISIDKPSELAETALINLRDVTFIRTERVTAAQLAGEHRMAGIRTANRSASDEKLLKSLSQIKFI